MCIAIVVSIANAIHTVETKIANLTYWCLLMATKLASLPYYKPGICHCFFHISLKHPHNMFLSDWFILWACNVEIINILSLIRYEFFKCVLWHKQPICNLSTRVKQTQCLVSPFRLITTGKFIMQIVLICLHRRGIQLPKVPCGTSNTPWKKLRFFQDENSHIWNMAICL